MMAFVLVVSRDRDGLLLVVGEEQETAAAAAAAARVVVLSLVAGLGHSRAGWPETSAFIPIYQSSGRRNLAT
jgi:hypothetical protein